MARTPEERELDFYLIWAALIAAAAVFCIWLSLYYLEPVRDGDLRPLPTKIEYCKCECPGAKERVKIEPCKPTNKGGRHGK